MIGERREMKKEKREYVLSLFCLSYYKNRKRRKREREKRENVLSSGMA
jgi:hypothetical protein